MSSSIEQALTRCVSNGNFPMGRETMQLRDSPCLAPYIISPFVMRANRRVATLHTFYLIILVYFFKLTMVNIFLYRHRICITCMIIFGCIVIIPSVMYFLVISYCVNYEVIKKKKIILTIDLLPSPGSVPSP